MSTPFILPDQSAPVGRQFREYFFQPVAAYEPTVWTCSPLSPGLSLDTATGRIGGLPTVAGTCFFFMRAGSPVSLAGAETTSSSVTVTCEDTSGLEAGAGIIGPGIPTGATVASVIDATSFTLSAPATASDTDLDLTAFWDRFSPPMLFAMAVEPSPPLAPGGFFGVVIELSTGEVTYEPAVLTLKSGDDFLQQIQLRRNGIVVDLDVSSFICSLKFGEDDDTIVESTDWVKVGTGEATVYRVACVLAGEDFDDALEAGAQRVNFRELAATEIARRIRQILVLAEYEIQYANSGEDLVGRDPAIWTSRTVGIEIVRELHEAAP